MTPERWPALPYDAWKDTYATLHMWSQIVGKIALARAAPINHSWGVAFDVTPRGLTTRTLPHGDRSFRVAFDFIDHQLVIETSDSNRRALPLAPRTVADFYREVMATLRDMALPVTIWPMPVEVPDPIPVQRGYCPPFVRPDAREPVLAHSPEIQEASPSKRQRLRRQVQPGALLLGQLRPRGDALLRPAGPTARRAGVHARRLFPRSDQSWLLARKRAGAGAGVLRVRRPRATGPQGRPVRPDGAYYHRELGEFILPYEAVRSSAAPELAITEFVDSTYTRAATLANWDRAALEANPRASRGGDDR